MFEKVDCIRIQVPDISSGLEYYHEQLGLPIKWRTENAVGLSLQDNISEIVLHMENFPIEIDFKVKSVPESLNHIEKAGGKIIEGPFDIDIGKCAVVQDPWGNQYVILDSSKGLYQVDKDGTVIGIGQDHGSQNPNSR